jgi:hypothetical protein
VKKWKEIEGIKRRCEEIADATIGQGYAGSQEKLFADWAHQLSAHTIPELVIEISELKRLLCWMVRNCHMMNLSALGSMQENLADINEVLNDIDSSSSSNCSGSRDDRT